MKITVNNKERYVPEEYGLEDLLKEMGLDTSVAVWVNDIQLLRKNYSAYRLKEKDRVKIFRPIGGG
ncbi:thiamine biosynthesis protein ThiS [Natronincola peptidivorans]|uniref:Thiamine biosynthesis protein ThiS n=1 Tax=Natronincola peptidivorans TaxID=426128 RepID=A0A1I0GZ64_9FIRM|nr:sulfur carrier protein ThiS [Natronincola peptidivorans]SET76545.1 thiamine biosynthesis protein ThiS [Natronincola peptidivorans]